MKKNMLGKRVRKSKMSINPYVHKDKKRANNPPVGLVSTSTDKPHGRTEYNYDCIPSLIFWAKNDQLAFEIFYMWKELTQTYYQGFILRIKENRFIVLEVKGQTKEQNKAKWAAAKEGVRAVNMEKMLGIWRFVVFQSNLMFIAY